MAGLDITGLATTFVQCLASQAWVEARYLRKYNSYVEDFKNERQKLSAKVKSVEAKKDEARKRNKTIVDPIVEDWLERANKLLEEVAQPTKCFSLCTNCCSQIAQAKELERSTTDLIPKLIAEVDKFPVELARAAPVPGMEFHSQEFMSFESRKEKFEELKKALEDENNYKIGLQGMGGTGKSIMAIEVGKLVENSNPFDRVIFVSVSTPVDEKRIREDIAMKLELQLEEEKLQTHAQQMWNKISSIGKVLIILDDVWEKLDLYNMGIQPRKGRCSVLLTTRYENICTQMECQKKIKLEDLDEKDALNLFLSHAMEIGQDCPDDLKKVAMNIVNECGRLPVIVVAVANALKDWPQREWHNALKALESFDGPSGHGIVEENAMKFYKSLKLSYDHLNDKQAQVLFLLCSIFPKAHEISVELLSRIAIGLEFFRGVDKYDVARAQVLMKKNKLIVSSLLLKAGEECVKLHDVIREMALEIANEEAQVVMSSDTNLKNNMKYSSWIINGFPNCFNDSKLEVLLVWINVNGSLKVPYTLFGGMKSLRVLLFHSKFEFGRTLSPSLPQSIQLLKHIRTLSLTNWELEDISVLMRSLQKLESLELTNCSIVELPIEISEPNRLLRFLCLIRCSLEKNHPFEVIAKCSKLEELYYVSNDDHIPTTKKVSQISSLPKFEIYHIDGRNFNAFDSSQLDTSIKRSFKPNKLQRIFSKELIETMATRAEILELRGDKATAWNNLIPSVVSIEDNTMKDLIKLSLRYWYEMKCLIHTEHLQLKSGETVFPKLAELQLDGVSMKEICCGPYPDGFLKQLEKLELRYCMELESTLFKGELELGNLKSIQIRDCSMTCLFHPCTAQSLRQLETLIIGRCSHLKYMMKDEGSSREEREEEKVGDKDPNPRIHDQMFPKLKLLRFEICEELEFVLPICFCEDLPLLENVEVRRCEKLKYMIGQYPEEQGLHKMQKEMTLHSFKVMSIAGCPSFINIYPECYLPQKSVASMGEGPKENDKSPSRNASRGPLCCFLPKSKTLNKDESSTSTAAQPNHTASQEKYVGNRAHGIFTPPLYPCKLREMRIGDIANLRSLFSISIASSMFQLEKLVVFNCAELENIVKEEVEGQDHKNVTSIFPNLHAIEVWECHKLEYVFPASCSTHFVYLESVHISRAPQLKYVFGKFCDDDNSPRQNHITKIHLTSLNKLGLQQVENMVNVCPENYSVIASSLKEIILGDCSQLSINSFIDFSVQRQKGQEQLSTNKIIGIHSCNLKHLTLESLDVETIYDIERLQIRSPVNSSLETLSLATLDKLRNICVGPKNLHMSFQNLLRLKIFQCNKLEFILSTSILRSLQFLTRLSVVDCEERERIIEDDDDQECCFPNLLMIVVIHCKKLKCLFSISACSSLPKLMMLEIGDAPELEQVFVWKQSPTQELNIKHVFPKLFMIFLRDLPELHTICSGIDFLTVIVRYVNYCPKIPFLTSTDSEFLDGYAQWLIDSDDKNNGDMDKDDLFEQHLNRIRDVAEKTANRDSPTAEQNIAPSYPIEETADEVKDAEQIYNPAPLAAPSQIEVSQSKRGLYLHSKHPQITKPTDFSSNTKSSQETVKPTFQEGSKSDEVALTTNQMMGPESSKSSPTAFLVSSENECPHIPSLSTPKKTQIKQSEGEGSQSDLLDVYITESAQDEEIKITQAETYMPCMSKELEDDELMKLFQIMEEGDRQDDSKVTKALGDLEASLKMGLNEIASSEENKLCLENALNTLSSHCSDDGLKASICSLQQEIQTILSSFKQACAIIDTMTKLEQKEKLMMEQRLPQKEAAMTLLSEILKAQNFRVEAQTRVAELKEQISKFQAELCSTENEIKVCDIKLLSLQEQKKKSISDTTGFMKELEAVKKERSHKVEDQLKARLQLENMDSEWSSCLTNLKKTLLQLGVHLKHKI